MKKDELLSTRIGFLTVIIVAVSVLAGMTVSLCSRQNDIPVLPTDESIVTAHDSAMIKAEEKRIEASHKPVRDRHKSDKAARRKKEDKPQSRNYLLTPEQELPGQNTNQQSEKIAE